MPDSPMDYFPARLRELRRAAGLTQKSLAAKAGISWKNVANWEQGIFEPGWSQIAALAAALGTDCRAFLQPAAKQPKPKPGRPRNPE